MEDSDVTNSNTQHCYSAGNMAWKSATSKVGLPQHAAVRLLQIAHAKEKMWSFSCCL